MSDPSHYPIRGVFARDRKRVNADRDAQLGPPDAQPGDKAKGHIGKPDEPHSTDKQGHAADGPAGARCPPRWAS